MPAFSQAAWVFGAANAGALKAITRAKASMETRVFIVFPPVTLGRINDLAAAFAQQVSATQCRDCPNGCPKKKGAGGLSSGPSFSGLRLGGPRDRPPSSGDECRHSCLPSCKETGGHSSQAHSPSVRNNLP